MELEATDIVKMDIWTHYTLGYADSALNPEDGPSELSLHFPSVTLVIQGVVAWLCVLMQLYFTYELLAYTTRGAIDDLKEQKELEYNVTSLSMGELPHTAVNWTEESYLPDISGRHHLTYLTSLLVIVLMTTTDIYRHLQFFCLCILHVKVSPDKCYWIGGTVLIAAQIYQSVLTAYVAYAITMLQDNIVDVFMNFAAILIIAEIDNTVGAWWMTNLTPLKGHMVVKYNDVINYAHSMVTAAICKYASWSFVLVISGTFAYGYCQRDRMVFCNSLGTVTIVTAVTEVVAPFIALILMIARAGCQQSTKSSDPAFNTIITLPRTGDSVTYPADGRYQDYLKDEYPDEYDDYFKGVPNKHDSDEAHARGATVNDNDSRV